jgi:hypothetical protein
MYFIELFGCQTEVYISGVLCSVSVYMRFLRIYETFYLTPRYVHIIMFYFHACLIRVDCTRAYIYVTYVLLTEC